MPPNSFMMADCCNFSSKESKVSLFCSAQNTALSQTSGFMACACLTVHCAHPPFLGYLTRKTGPPAPPTAASLILPAKLMIYREKPAKNPSLGKKSAKVFYFSYISVRQLQGHCEPTFFLGRLKQLIVSLHPPSPIPPSLNPPFSSLW